MWKKDYNKNKHCKCGKLITNNAILCQKCRNTGKNSPVYIDGRTLKKYFCIKCGKKIYEDTYLYGNKQCKSCARYKNGKGYEKYPIEFTKKLKYKILKRDNFTCQKCNQYGTILKNKLTIHHIDYNKFNCNENNLITLCFKCNVRANFNREYW